MTMKRLYKIEAKHVTLTSSHRCLVGYTVAENDEKIYQLIANEKILGVCCAWNYQEHDNVTINDEPFKAISMMTITVKGVWGPSQFDSIITCYSNYKKAYWKLLKRMLFIKRKIACFFIELLLFRYLQIKAK